MQVLRGVLPIEVEPLSEADAGEEGEWLSLLGGCCHHKLPVVHAPSKHCYCRGLV